MDQRFLDGLMREAHALSEEALLLLTHRRTAGETAMPDVLNSRAVETTVVALLMDAVAWLSLFNIADSGAGRPGLPLNRKATLDTGDVEAELDPNLADLLQRTQDLHARLERLETDCTQVVTKEKTSTLSEQDEP
mgnify:CR=1 FL=1